MLIQIYIGNYRNNLEQKNFVKQNVFQIFQRIKIRNQFIKKSAFGNGSF